MRSQAGALPPLTEWSKLVRLGLIVHNVTGAPAGVEVSSFGRSGTWVVVLNNCNCNPINAPLGLHVDSETAVRAEQVVRTSAAED